MTIGVNISLKNVEKKALFTQAIVITPRYILVNKSDKPIGVA